MKSIKKIGVKFCGNCNPQVNTLQLLEEIKEYYYDIKFVKWDEEDYDLLIVLNSCSVGCSTHPDFFGTKIIIENNSINYEPVSKENLFCETIKTINEHTKI